MRDKRPKVVVFVTCLVVGNLLAFPNRSGRSRTRCSVISTAYTERNWDGTADWLPTVELLSLRWPPDSAISPPVRALWRWKDEGLGDGRDFFVPKPNTIRALQDFIIKSSPSVQDCVVISNCARLEVIFVPADDTNNNTAIHEISRSFAAQLSSYQERKSSILFQLTKSLDMPNVAIDSNSASLDMVSVADVREIETHWNRVVGVEDILEHLCLVAAGIATRPRRPNREVIFRPFSSRDAHIMLQLKRTKDVANDRTCNLLLEYALRAGKGVRTIEKVPELQELKKYGSSDSKYSQAPPNELSASVADAAVVRVIVPLVRELSEKLVASQRGRAIARLRRKAEELASDKEQLAVVRKLLHIPTKQLRSDPQIRVNEDALLEEIEDALSKERA